MKKLPFELMEVLDKMANVHCMGSCDECPFQELPCTDPQIDYHLKNHGYCTLAEFREYKEKWSND